ncbi:hypothetical protein [Streptomyces sp. NBC_01306]|uniref:hypothetical protein n=1 Tax=Streptomyces sp. NBC_01306 TaxID=2903819 RepID=UPI00224C9C38|nr:hypothetical protein [Streptomyces sp. NBC_01306]MCX4728794.1 hypothetical protein [Streptomyces sp. NBC_01306]
MTGTDDAGDDSLYVLTAVLLTPAQFPSVLGDDFPSACHSLGITPRPDGYGMVLGQDGAGARWTVVIDDVSLVAVAIASWDCGMEYDLSPDDRSIVASLPGWPLDVAVAAPGIPAPHDPEGLPDGGPVPLAPPPADIWGPAQRRLGADEIALQWAQWREQIGDDEAFVPVDSGESGEPREAGAPGEATGATEAGTSSEPGEKQPSPARRVIDELHAYLNTPPPLGRIRSAFAPEGARTLRADGPGWSLVARTDDMAFVLLDDQPGDVVPIGRGPALPELLKSLEKLAVRPA